MMTTSPPTPDQARDALRQADALNPTRSRDVATLRFFSLALSVALAAVLVLVRLTMSAGSMRVPLFVIGMVVFGLVVVGLVLVQMRVRSLPRGWRTIYIVSFAVSMLAYCIWIIVITRWPNPGVPLGLMAVAVATTVIPGVVAARLIGSPQFAKAAR